MQIELILNSLTMLILGTLSGIWAADKALAFKKSQAVKLDTIQDVITLLVFLYYAPVSIVVGAMAFFHIRSKQKRYASTSEPLLPKV